MGKLEVISTLKLAFSTSYYLISGFRLSTYELELILGYIICIDHLITLLLIIFFKETSKTPMSALPSSNIKLLLATVA